MAELKRRGRKEESVVDPVEKKKLISTGSTMLNLALSDKADCGYALGSVVHVIGDTHAGKSLLCLTAMAEASHNKDLNDYDLVYEEPECAMFFPIEKMFGKKTYDRIRFIPDKQDRVEPRTVQQWHKDLIDSKPPFIWVTDSFDALTSIDDLKDDEPTKGGWRTEKAGVASQLMPKIVGKIEATNSLLIWVSQTRDKLGMTFGNPKTFSGGNAIKFYRSYEIWLAVVERIKEKVRKKDREVGAVVRAKITKNKFTGKIREIEFPVYYDFGVDDIGSMIDWLVDEGFWIKEKNKATIETNGFTTDGKRNTIIDYIEDNDLEQELRKFVEGCWFELEQEITEKTRRKAKYE